MRRSRRRRALLPFDPPTDLMLAPAVIAFRLPVLAAEAGTRDALGAETIRMVTEKAAAAAEGLTAAQLALARSALAFWPELLSGRMPSLIDGRAARQAMEAALKPAGKRVRSNFRRLSKPR